MGSSAPPPACPPCEPPHRASCCPRRRFFPPRNGILGRSPHTMHSKAAQLELRQPQRCARQRWKCALNRAALMPPTADTTCFQASILAFDWPGHDPDRPEGDGWHPLGGRRVPEGCISPRLSRSRHPRNRKSACRRRRGLTLPLTELSAHGTHQQMMPREHVSKWPRVSRDSVRRRWRPIQDE